MKNKNKKNLPSDNGPQNSCPLSQKQIIDKFFIETRTKILDAAAFLDRLDRSVDKNAEDDFRYTAFKNAVSILSSNTGERVERILISLSDTTEKPIKKLLQKNASGAFAPKGGLRKKS